MHASDDFICRYVDLSSACMQTSPLWNSWSQCSLRHQRLAYAYTRRAVQLIHVHLKRCSQAFSFIVIFYSLFVEKCQLDLVVCQLESRAKPVWDATDIMDVINRFIGDCMLPQLSGRRFTGVSSSDIQYSRTGEINRTSYLSTSPIPVIYDLRACGKLPSLFLRKRGGIVAWSTTISFEEQHNVRNFKWRYGATSMLNWQQCISRKRPNPSFQIRNSSVACLLGDDRYNNLCRSPHAVAK